MASIKKDKKTGLYFVRYDAGYNSKGGRIQRRKGGFIRKGDAELFLSEMTIRKATGGLSIDPKMTLGEYWKEYIESRADIEENTRATYNQSLNLMDEIKGIPLEKLKPLHINKWLGSLQNGKHKESTIKLYYSKLKTVLRDAVKNDLLIKSPCTQVSVPKSKTENVGDREKFLTKKEVSSLLKYTENTDHYLSIYLILTLGLRKGEALGLQWGDVDLKKKEVNLTHNYTREKNKAVLKDYLKNVYSKRTLELSNEVIRALKAQKSIQAANKLALGDKNIKNDFVCTDKEGNPLNPSDFNKVLTNISKELNILEFTPHELRHTSASLMISSGMNLKTVSKILGHADTKMVDRIYAHIYKDDQRGFLNQLSSIIEDVKKM